VPQEPQVVVRQLAGRPVETVRLRGTAVRPIAVLLVFDIPYYISRQQEKHLICQQGVRHFFNLFDVKITTYRRTMDFHIRYKCETMHILNVKYRVPNLVRSDTSFT
jgi:hypothetical protein